MRDTTIQTTPGLPRSSQGSPPEELSRVVVATDFSPRAERALARAAHLPLREGAQVYVLHVRTPCPEGDPLDQQEQQVVERALGAAVREVASQRARQHLHVEVQPVLRTGQPVAQMAQLAEETHAELVVMGRPHLLTALWGREAHFRPEQLLRQVHASLLMVAPHEARPYRRPLVAVDFSPPARKALELTFLLCPRAHSVGVVHVCDTSYELVLHMAWTSYERLLRYREEARAEAQAVLERFLATVDGAPPTFAPMVMTGNREDGVLAAVNTHQADLIALGSRPSVAFAEVLLGTLAGKVLRETACDVLIAR